MKNNKKLLKTIILFIISFPPICFFGIALTDIDVNIKPQLSEKTVLSLCDNLSHLEMTGKSNFEDDKFHLVFCDETKTGCYSNFDFFQNKALAYIEYDNILSIQIDYPVKFYYDTLDNCTKYYEISYIPELNKALCIYGKISRTNPFSAKIIWLDK